MDDTYLLERLDGIHEKLDNQSTQIYERLDEQAKNLSETTVSMAKLPCERHDDRIKLLQRVVYGAVALVLLSWLTTMIDLGKGDKDTIIAKPAIADTE